MRIVAVALGVSVLFGVAAVPADACGDKLLVIGRRVKRIPRAKHPAVVLLYLRPGSALPKAAKKMDLETTLRQAGHSVDAVDQEDRLRAQLGTGRYDFVFTDLPDAASVAREAGAVPGAPEVVPVASEADEDALRASRETYPLVIRAEKGRSYLSALDAAMQHREGR
jgi:hypothetical protein